MDDETVPSGGSDDADHPGVSIHLHGLAILNHGSRIGCADGGWNVVLPGHDGAVAQDAASVTAVMYGAGGGLFSGAGFGPVSQVMDRARLVVHAIVALVG